MLPLVFVINAAKQKKIFMDNTMFFRSAIVINNNICTIIIHYNVYTYTYICFMNCVQYLCRRYVLRT